MYVFAIGNNGMHLFYPLTPLLFLTPLALVRLFCPFFISELCLSSINLALHRVHDLHEAVKLYHLRLERKAVLAPSARSSSPVFSVLTGIYFSTRNEKCCLMFVREMRHPLVVSAIAQGEDAKP